MKFYVKLSHGKEYFYYGLGLIFLIFEVWQLSITDYSMNYDSIFRLIAFFGLGLYCLYFGYICSFGLWYLDFRRDEIICRKGFAKRVIRRNNIINISTFRNRKQVFLGIFEREPQGLLKWNGTSFWIPLIKGKEDSQLSEIGELVNRSSSY